MLGQLPVNISEAVEVIYTTAELYHDDNRVHRFMASSDTTEYQGQDYKTVSVFKETLVLPEYKKYNIAVPSKHLIKIEVVSTVEEKLRLLGL